ncbi:MAG: hypothetical protein ABGW69_02825 [Nanoarchaeota archaeon]
MRSGNRQGKCRGLGKNREIGKRGFGRRNQDFKELNYENNNNYNKYSDFRGFRKGNKGKKKGKAYCWQEFIQEYGLTEEELNELWLKKPRGVPFREFIKEYLRKNSE